MEKFTLIDMRLSINQMKCVSIANRLYATNDNDDDDSMKRQIEFVDNRRCFRHELNARRTNVDGKKKEFLMNESGKQCLKLMENDARRI
uniref:Uncharacterized protein n=1 Tax=Syphacia muris TaxID=451379 RepID=A0A0N5AT02_9BILA